jgi:hypothetical protein
LDEAARECHHACFEGGRDAFEACVEGGGAEQDCHGSAREAAMACLSESCGVEAPPAPPDGERPPRGERPEGERPAPPDGERPPRGERPEGEQGERPAPSAEEQAAHECRHSCLEGGHEAFEACAQSGGTREECGPSAREVVDACLTETCGLELPEGPPGARCGHPEGEEGEEGERPAPPEGEGHQGPPPGGRPPRGERPDEDEDGE